MKYLLYIDDFSGFPYVWSVDPGGGARNLKERLIEAFCSFGVPMVLTTDGGPEYTAQETKYFLKRWGLKDRLCSAYNPYANLRAESGVKSMKRILKNSLDSTYSLKLEQHSCNTGTLH